jgi:hypothetical protein
MAHEWFNHSSAQGILITPEQSAEDLIAYLTGNDTGAIWDFSNAPVGS